MDPQVEEELDGLADSIDLCHHDLQLPPGFKADDDRSRIFSEIVPGINREMAGRHRMTALAHSSAHPIEHPANGSLSLCRRTCRTLMPVLIVATSGWLRT